MQGLFEGPANGHNLAHGFHAGGEQILCLGKFLKGPSGDFDNAIIDCRLKGGQGFPGDIVGQLIKAVPYGQLCSDLGDGKPRCLRCKG